MNPRAIEYIREKDIPWWAIVLPIVVILWRFDAWHRATSWVTLTEVFAVLTVPSAMFIRAKLAMPKRFLDFRPDGIALLTKRGETADLIPQGQIREMLYVHETLTSSGTTERQIAATLKNANVVAGGTRPDLRRFKFGHFRGLDISLGDGSRRFFKMPIGELPLLQLEIYKNKASYPEPRHVRRRLLRGGYAPFEE